jgi:hypothetical protein
LPYCRECGIEIAEGNWLCPSCQFSQTQPPMPRNETVIIQQRSNVGEVMEAIFLIALIAGGIYFVGAVEVFDCPRCHSNDWVSWSDSYCGYDGKVTLVQLLTYSGG